MTDTSKIHLTRKLHKVHTSSNCKVPEITGTLNSIPIIFSAKFTTKYDRIKFSLFKASVNIQYLVPYAINLHKNNKNIVQKANKEYSTTKPNKNKILPNNYRTNTRNPIVFESSHLSNCIAPLITHMDLVIQPRTSISQNFPIKRGNNETFHNNRTINVNTITKSQI